LTLLLLWRGGSLCHLFCKIAIPDNALGMEAALGRIKVQEEGDEWMACKEGDPKGNESTSA
jgi:hypothetical protein